MKEESTIKQCSIVVTRQCNLRCNFCYAKSAGYGENDLIDYNDIKDIIDFCVDAKVKYIFFTGGEPLTYPYLFDALKYIKTNPHRIETALATNGVLLKNFDFCKKVLKKCIFFPF